MPSTGAWVVGGLLAAEATGVTDVTPISGGASGDDSGGGGSGGMPPAVAAMLAQGRQAAGRATGGNASPMPSLDLNIPSGAGSTGGGMSPADVFAMVQASKPEVPKAPNVDVPTPQSPWWSDRITTPGLPNGPPDWMTNPPWETPTLPGQGDGGSGSGGSGSGGGGSGPPEARGGNVFLEAARGTGDAMGAAMRTVGGPGDPADSGSVFGGIRRAGQLMQGSNFGRAWDKNTPDVRVNGLPGVDGGPSPSGDQVARASAAATDAAGFGNREAPQFIKENAASDPKLPEKFERLQASSGGSF